MKRKQRQRTPKRTSTALVRRSAPALTIHDPAQRLPLPMGAGFPALAPVAPLGLEPIVAAGFVGTLQLSQAQIEALRRPVADTEIEWKPNKAGEPTIPYLSHNGFRDRLDACFGLGGWGMVPVGAPREKDGIAYIPYALVIGGQPRVYAWGEQEYFENNRMMTWGDALEGAKSNALTRCGKELGIARELWDRKYLTALKARLLPTVQYFERQPMKRETRAALLAIERRAQGHGTEPAHPDQPRTYAPAAHDAKDTRKITTGPRSQQARLFVFLRKFNRDEARVKTWMQQAYGFSSTSELERWQYDDFIAALESGDCYLEPASEDA